MVRLVDLDDGRATLVEITDKGRVLLTRLQQAQRDNLDELLTTLSSHEEETLGLAMRVVALLLDQLNSVRK